MNAAPPRTAGARLPSGAPVGNMGAEVAFGCWGQFGRAADTMTAHMRTALEREIENP